MKKLESQLKNLRTQSAPRKDFQAALWVELNEAFEETYPSMVFVWRQALAVPLAVLVIFLSTGAGVYAYASPSVTNDHALYPVKRGIESMEKAWPRSPESAAHFHARMMERRMAEGMYLYHRQAFHATVLEDVAREFDRALQEMEAVDEEVEIRIIIIDQIGRQTGEYRALLEAMIAEERDASTLREAMLRNNMEGVRVRITESTLNEDEKQELLYRLQFDNELPRSLEFEVVQ